ncbi:lipid-A-disaccharide synthase [Muriicola jejuensis]|uniref:Lipid-A-disaccharide synthase n=1 Tax=Muriicola jejuensis TaxID=504488 RepID=A0A6P0UIF3_9FLAO|nr:lipid-A-disaccharide synthase [Muriicola jejuensis]NER11648.1 lipid-A-disaccharide synthase [Muriicola jejuensis]SMP25715.1 lipid-A-disaccharide synthase [Muriicola jejuensis]
MKYYIIAGEASGDLHGSNLIRALIKADPEADVRCWGGDLMEQAGGTLVKHYKEMAFMGFAEVLANIRQIFKNITFCKEDIDAFKPDVVIFIDFSGFNLRIASWAKAEGCRTNYYISPQVWASREGRVRKIKSSIDDMYVILPFEKSFYEEKHGFPVHYVGHPLLDAIEAGETTDPSGFRKKHGLSTEKDIIALLPGSRKQEVEKMLSLMLSVVPVFPDHEFVIAGAPSLDNDFYEKFTGNSRVHFVTGETYALLQCARAALVTSGTATLETALFKVPQVVCYKGSWLSYQIARRIITLKYISLVNLIMDREVVTELIQNDLTHQALVTELKAILSGPKRDAVLAAYEKLETKLGGGGASEKAAGMIVDSIKT